MIWVLCILGYWGIVGFLYTLVTEVQLPLVSKGLNMVLVTRV